MKKEVMGTCLDTTVTLLESEYMGKRTYKHSREIFKSQTTNSFHKTQDKRESKGLNNAIMGGVMDRLTSYESPTDNVVNFSILNVLCVC